MMVSTFTGVATPDTVNYINLVDSKIDSSVVRQVEERKTAKEISKEIDGFMSTEEYIKQYFKDIPIMIHIAKCESTFRQLAPDGDVHRGRKNSADVGVMQINEFYHGDKAEKENYDLHTLEGNVAYARNLYERQGTKPWSASKACWGKYETKSLAINK